jgi:hypothetical protein
VVVADVVAAAAVGAVAAAEVKKMGIADRDRITGKAQLTMDGDTAKDVFQKTAVKTVVEDGQGFEAQVCLRGLPETAVKTALEDGLPQRSQLGIGWRPELAVAIERRTDLEFVEIVAENFSLKSLPEPLMDLRRRGLDVIPHGISLSLGGAQLPDIHRIRHLNELAAQFDSPFVSEHIAFVRAANLDSGHLLPVPRTERAARVLVDNISFAKEHLHVPLVLENVAYLCEWKNSEMDEAEFVRYILEETDSMMLLDVANLLANSINHDFDAVAYLRNIPLERIEYVHIAGGILRGGLYHDTHAHPVPNKVLELLKTLAQLHLPPRVMLERDDHFPIAEVLNAELDAIKDAVSVAPSTALCSGSPAPENTDESWTGLWSAGGSPASENTNHKPVVEVTHTGLAAFTHS